MTRALSICSHFYVCMSILTLLLIIIFYFRNFQGLSPESAERWMKKLPTAKIPVAGTEGADFREHALVQQIPKQDLSIKYCQHVDSPHRSSYADFVSARNDVAIDVAVAVDSAKPGADCYKCAGAIDDGLAVMAPKYGLSTFWHPQCFSCSVCDEFLVSQDLAY